MTVRKENRLRAFPPDIVASVWSVRTHQAVMLIYKAKCEGGRFFLRKFTWRVDIWVFLLVRHLCCDGGDLNLFCWGERPSSTQDRASIFEAGGGPYGRYMHLSFSYYT